jgi:RHS repeat-associated protein
LWHVYEGIVLRAEIIGEEPGVEPPANITPFNDYHRFALRIDELAPSFVCQMHADSEDTFNSYFSTLDADSNYPGYFPMWSVSNLHAAAGFTNWSTNVVLHSWSITDRSIQRQVQNALNLLIWTGETRPARYDYAGYKRSLRDPGVWYPNWYEGDEPYARTLSEAYARQQDDWENGSWEWRDPGLEGGYGIWAEYTRRVLRPWKLFDYSGSSNPDRNGQYTNTGLVSSRWPVFSNGKKWIYLSDQVDEEPGCRHWACANSLDEVETYSRTCGPEFETMLGDWVLTNGVDDGQVELLQTSTEVAHRFDGYRWTARQIIDGLATSVSHRAEAYQSFGGIKVDNILSPFRPKDSFVTMSNRFFMLESFSEAAVTQRVGLVMSRTVNQELEDNPVYMAWSTAPTNLAGTNVVKHLLGVFSGAHNQLGFWDSRKTRWLLKWDGDMGLPPIEPCPDVGFDLLADINRDEVVEPGLSFDKFGPDTGTIMLLHDEKQAVAGLLLSRSPVWHQHAPIYNWLADVGLNYLPYHYLVPGEKDDDGPYQAISFNSRVLETGVARSNTLKRVSLLRPSGRLVCFEFEQTSHGSFSSKGYPIGINSNRTYTLLDVTPDDHLDARYDLLFDSGYVHEFDKWLTGVRSPQGFMTPVFMRFRDGRYSVSINELYGRVDHVVYGARDGTDDIISQIEYFPSGKINAISKSGLPAIEDSNASMSADRQRVDYAWGHVSRQLTNSAGDGRTIDDMHVSFDHGSLSRHYEYSSRGLLTKMIIQKGAHAASTIYDYYDSAMGRYMNGRPKWSLFKKVTMPNTSSVEYSYTPDEGWLEEEREDYTESLQKVTRYEYVVHSGPGAGVAPDPRLYYAEPRTMEERIGSTITKKELYGYTADADKITKQCPTSSADWTSTNTLTFQKYYYTNGLYKGYTRLVETPDGTEHHNYAEWNGQLTIYRWNSQNQDTLSKINAFGITTLHQQKNEGKKAIDTESVCDSFGRILSTTYLNKTSTSNLLYSLHGPAIRYDMSGTPKVIDYYNNGLIRAEAQIDLSSQTYFKYDALGNMTERHDTVHGAELLTRAEHDAVGQEVWFEGPIGKRQVMRSLDGKAVKAAITYPDSTQAVISTYPDGRRKSSKGSIAKRMQEYEYGVENGLSFVKHIMVTGGRKSQWRKTWFNMLGLPVKQQTSGAKPGALKIFKYDPKWKLVSFVDEMGVRYAQNINEMQELDRSGIDMDNQEGLQTLGRDRVTEYASEVTEEGVRAKASVFPIQNNDSSVVQAGIATSHDGRSLSYFSKGITNSTLVSVPQPGGKYVVSNVLNNIETIANYDEWRLVSITNRNSQGKVLHSERYAYHPFGQLKQIIRNSGTTDIELDALSRIKSVQGEDKRKPPIRLVYHDNTFLIKEVTWTNGKTSRYSYFPNGLVKTIDEGTDGMVAYEYDEQSRLLAQTTHRDGKEITTRWAYYPGSGLLQSKIRPGQANPETYEYYDNGQLAAITTPDQSRTAFYYTPAGDLFSSRTSPDNQVVYQARDRLGRIIYELNPQSGGVYREYDQNDNALFEMQVSTLSIPSFSQTCEYSEKVPAPANKRLQLTGQNSWLASTGYTDEGRIATTSMGPLKVAYTYSTNHPSVELAEVTLNDSPVLTYRYDWAGPDGLLKSVTALRSADVMESFVLGRENDSLQVNEVRQHDGTRWHYAFDESMQLVAGNKLTAEGLLIPGYAYGYRYDEAGNMLKGGRTHGSDHLRGYDLNDMNLQIARYWEDGVEVVGTADPNAMVSVNGLMADRIQDWFRVRVLTGYREQAGIIPVKVTAVMPDAQGNDQYDVVDAELSIPASDSRVTHNQSGAALLDSRLEYSWSSDHRLKSVESKNPDRRFKCEFAYLPDGRRLQKKVFDWSEASGEYQLSCVHGYYYEDWNLVAELIQDHSQTHDPLNPDDSTVRKYFWGLDVAGLRSGWPGNRQGAGGIGGLLAILDDDKVLLPIADHVGNIRTVLDAQTGEVVARYDYSPFGELIAESGPEADRCPFRFNSRYEDSETGLLCYNYRYYDPASCKWLSDDPIGEAGGENLSQFAFNDPVNIIDPFGAAGFFFDGTWDHPGRTGEVNGLNFNAESLVSRMANAYLSGTPFYERGIGNPEDNGLITGKLGGAFGLGGKSILSKMYDRLERHYNNSEDRHLDIFGFSRGAAQALEFANMIKTRGIEDASSPLRRKMAGWKPGGKSLRFTKERERRFKNPPIRFIGVLDTVGAFGMPRSILSLVPFQSINIGYRLRVPGNVQHAYHALALDEGRDAFDVTRLPNAYEVWFRGIHSTVGGSNHAWDRRLPDIVAIWMMEQAKKSGVQFKDYAAEFGEPIPGGRGDVPDQFIGYLGFPYRHFERNVRPGDKVHQSVDRSLYPAMPPNVQIVGD